jgi:hypothetical protein
MVKFCIFYFQKMLFLESELPPTLTQNYGRLPHIIFMFLNQVYLNAHSVKKWKLFNYIEIEKTSSLNENIF